MKISLFSLLLSISTASFAAGAPPVVYSDITEVQFNAVLDKVGRLYPQVKFVKLWTSPTINAIAERVGTEMRITMHGGLAKNRNMTLDGLALIACHEVGHHLGGAPLQTTVRQYMSGEGQSDYFATLKCLRNYFADEDNVTKVAALRIHPIAKDECEKSFSNRADELICMRSSRAAEDVAYFFKVQRKEKKMPKIETPSAWVIGKTYDFYTNSQCRLDTMFQGSLCSVDRSIGVSQTDARIGTCNEGIGSRPRCWYKP